MREWYQGGNGSATSPFRIATYGNLVQMSFDINVNNWQNRFFIMINDIDMSEMSENYIPIGATFPFTGKFDGDGHKLFWNNENPYNAVASARPGLWGIFGEVTSSHIKNIRISNFNVFLPILQTTQDPELAVGMLCGKASNSVFENIWLENFKMQMLSVKLRGFGSIVGYAENCHLTNILISNLSLQLIVKISPTYDKGEVGIICGDSYYPTTTCDYAFITVTEIKSNAEVEFFYLGCNGIGMFKLPADSPNIADFPLDPLGPGFGKASYITNGIPHLKAFFWEGQV